MKKRELVVESAEKALKLMLSMLAANMIDNDLESSPSAEDGVELHGEKYPVKLAWLDRGGDDFVGCPCFMCNFSGTLPTGNHVEAVVYVKTFAARTLTMCKMHLLKKDSPVQCQEIKDGMTFDMNDCSRGFVAERYLYKDGKISLFR